MTHLGTIEGIGRLIIGSREIDDVKYRISAHSSGEFATTKTSGTLKVDISELFDPDIQTKGVMLELEGGEKVPIFNIKFRSNLITCTVGGRVPGL